MTDPTTLSAAELDELANRTEDGLLYAHGLRGVVMDGEDVGRLVAMARRTEAAERKLAKIEYALTHSETLDVGREVYVWTGIIRRALAED